MNQNGQGLKITKLTKTFPTRDGRLTAVAEADFFLPEGQTLGLVGESGSGKSTLARIIAGLETPDSGSVTFPAGWKKSPGGAGPAQMIFQNPQGSLNSRLSIRASMLESIQAREGKGTPRAAMEQEAAEWLRKVKLDPAFLDRYPHEFSGGQRQRIALARALAAKPRLLIADEPTSALDVSIQAQMLGLLRALIREENLTLLLITHNLHVAVFLCDTLFVMQRGHIVERGQASEILTSPTHECSKELVRALATIPAVRA